MTVSLVLPAPFRGAGWRDHLEALFVRHGSQFVEEEMLLATGDTITVCLLRYEDSDDEQVADAIHIFGNLPTLH